MADSKKKSDPTVKAGTGDTYPEGTHPARPIAEADDNAYSKEYADNPDKPSEHSVAQVEVRPDEG